jgi:uncharacterized protein YjdB
MANGRRFPGKRLPLTLAFGVLVAVAIGAGCRGFFVKPTLSSITINPTAPSVQLGQTTTLQAFGVTSDGQGSNLTSGVSWSSSDPNTATVTGTGSATLKGIAIGTVTITASAQSVTNTATATVFIVVTSLTVSPTTWNPPAGQTTTQEFTVQANGSTDVTSGATFTPSNSAFSCPNGTDPVVCTANNPTANDYTITVTYPGTNLAPTIKVHVQ